MNGLPANISSEGGRIDALLYETHVFVIALTVLGVVGLIAAVVVGRYGTPRRFTGVGWKAAAIPMAFATLVFVVVDGNLFITSNIDLRDGLGMSGLRHPETALKVQINARQWAWDVRYPGVDDRFGTDDDIYLSGQFIVPVGRPVTVQLGAMDVVHALYIPNLRVKVDANPGRIAKLWFEATTDGVFDIACAQHCGVGHNRMAARLMVKRGDAFKAWYAQASRDAVRVSVAARELHKSSASSSPIQFPVFGDVVEMEPRGWGWSWDSGAK